MRRANGQDPENQDNSAEGQDRGGFEAGVQGWTGSNATVSQSLVNIPTSATAGSYSGQVTSPGANANIVFVTVNPVTYTVTWSVSLSGTLGAGDANNFGLYNGATFVTGS